MRYAAIFAMIFLAAVVHAADKPNILFIFADDQCFDTIHATGNKEIRTPHLDRLVASGTRFTHAYNMGGWNGAVCVASRAMLNSGRFIWRANKANLNTELAEGRLWGPMMKSAGYTTYMAGKWHVKAAAEKCFDVTGSVRGGMPNQTPQGYNRPKDENDKAWTPWDKSFEGFWRGGKHWSEVLGDETLSFLEKAEKDEYPFFMYVAFNAPHDPRQAPKEFVDMYPLDGIATPENYLTRYPHADDIGCSAKLRDEKLAPFPRTEYAVKVNRQEYYAIITHMDQQIGRILEALDKSGKKENTYIIFSADHGLSVGQHGLIGKQNMYDHSVRVPFLIAGPGIGKGEQIDTPIYLQDAMATSLELAGVEDAKHVEFKSLMPLIKGERKTQYDSIYGCYIKYQRMVSKDGWKLIYYPAKKVYRLFHVAEDRWEKNDLAAHPDHAMKLDALKSELNKLQKAMDDPLAPEA